MPQFGLSDHIMYTVDAQPKNKKVNTTTKEFKHHLGIEITSPYKSYIFHIDYTALNEPNSIINYQAKLTTTLHIYLFIISVL